jgi:hypothetical protein
MWQGLQSITDYKGRLNRDLPNDASLPDEHNAFYARFDNNNIEPRVRAVTDPEDWVILLSKADVKKVFNQVNTLKAVGPDGIPGHILRVCAEQLAGMFTVIVNLSMSQSAIPTCFKMTTIIPVPNNCKALCYNDYCPVALTSVIRKCF